MWIGIYKGIVTGQYQEYKRRYSNKASIVATAATNTTKLSDFNKYNTFDNDAFEYDELV